METEMFRLFESQLAVTSDILFNTRVDCLAAFKYLRLGGNAQDAPDISSRNIGSVAKVSTNFLLPFLKLIISLIMF